MLQVTLTKELEDEKKVTAEATVRSLFAEVMYLAI